MATLKPSIYAIDFGTSNSLLAGANHEMIFPPIPLDPFAQDNTVLRSVLFMPEDKSYLFGEEAIQAYSAHSSQGRLLRSIKKFLPDPGFKGTQILGKTYSIIDLVSLFLLKMRNTANQFFDADVNAVMLGRPAAFSLDSELDHLAEKRLEAAAHLAGFKHIYFCPEPLAAAYDYQKQMTSERLVLIADFGGGTSDFCVLKMGKDTIKTQDILAIGGISLAGDAYDGSIMKNKISHHFGSSVQYQLPMSTQVLQMPRHIMNKLNSPADMSFLARKDVVSFLQTVRHYSLTSQEEKKINQLLALSEEGLGFSIYKNIEQSKKSLSQSAETLFEFHHVAGIDIQEQITSDEFEIFSHDTSTKILSTLIDVINKSNIKAKDIDLVCLTGGTAQIKGIRTALEKIFGKQKIEEFRFFHSIIDGLAKKARESILSI